MNENPANVINCTILTSQLHDCCPASAQLANITREKDEDYDKIPDEVESTAVCTSSNLLLQNAHNRVEIAASHISFLLI